MSLGLAVAFDETYYTEVDPTTSGSIGSSTNPDVPAVWDVAVGGHGYMIDKDPQAAFHHESIPTLRPVFIEADSLGEKQINPESTWRSSQNTWHKGSGQRHLDLTDSDPDYYWQSKGVDPWTKWQISLLPDVNLERASVNGNLLLAVAGEYLYLADGSHVYYTTDLVTFTAVASTPAAAVTALCTDGFTIYMGFTGDGIYTTTRGSSGAATHFVTDAVTVESLGYVKGRLMASVGNLLYNVIASGAMPAPLMTHPNADFTWVGYGAGPSALYAAGFSGTTSEVYRVTITSDGTALSAPIEATPGIPSGEVLNTIGSYLGFVFLGSNLGVRMCETNSDGSLTLGALIESGACRCFTGQSRFVWFGWDDFDSESSGLGRMDLTIVNTSGAPAYASDLMAPAQDPVVDVETFNGLTVFTVAGVGLYAQSTALVEQGFLDSGLITYDLSDDKVALYLDVRNGEPMFGTIQASLSTDSGPFQFIGQLTDTGQTQTQMTVSELRGYTFEIRETLVRDTITPTNGPTVVRHTVESLPAVDSGLFMFVPVLLIEQVTAGNDQDMQMDVAAERAFLYALLESNTRVIYQEAGSSFPVTVDDLQWTAQNMTEDRSAWNGSCQLKLKSI